MRKNWAVGAAILALPALSYAAEATIQEVHDKPAVRGSIIASMLQDHDNPFTLYPYESNYLLYTDTSNITKKPFSLMTGRTMPSTMKLSSS